MLSQYAQSFEVGNQGGGGEVGGGGRGLGLNMCCGITLLAVTSTIIALRTRFDTSTVPQDMFAV